MFRFGFEEDLEGAEQFRQGCYRGNLVIEAGFFGVMAWSENLNPYLDCPFTRYLAYEALCKFLRPEEKRPGYRKVIEDFCIIGIAQQAKKLVPSEKQRLKRLGIHNEV